MKSGAHYCVLCVLYYDRYPTDVTVTVIFKSRFIAPESKKKTKEKEEKVVCKHKTQNKKKIRYGRRNKRSTHKRKRSRAYDKAV